MRTFIKNHFKFKRWRRILIAMEIEWAVPCREVARWVSAARAGGRNTVAVYV